MLWNYILIAFRTLKKSKLHSLINIFGLSLGMAVFVMIFTYVRFETSFDDHFEKSERVYRISLSFPEEALERAIATNFPVVHSAFPGLFPEIEKSTR